MVVAFGRNTLVASRASFAAAPGCVEVIVTGDTEVVPVLAEILELFPAGVLLVGIRDLVLVRALEAVPTGGTEVVPASVDVVSPLARILSWLPAVLELVWAGVLAVVGPLLVPAGARVKVFAPDEVEPEAADMVGSVPPHCEAVGRRLGEAINSAGAHIVGPDAAGRYSSGGCAP